MIHHSSTRVLTFGDMIAYDHCLLVVLNQKSKPPPSIRKCHCYTPFTPPHGYDCYSYNDLLRFIKKIGYFAILVLHKFMTKFQYHKISIELM